MIRTELTPEPIRPEEVLDAVGSPSHGAVLLFLGVVRDHQKGRGVKGLEYEAYREMAEGVLSEIGREAVDRFGIGDLAIVHRTGALAVGEVSLALAVASAHRAEAYEASRFVIERIKERLPIWKREHYVDGGSEWVPGQTPPEPGGPRQDSALTPPGSEDGGEGGAS